MDRSLGDEDAAEVVPDAIAAIAALDEPNRRALYRYVVAAGEPVGRVQAGCGPGAGPPHRPIPS